MKKYEEISKMFEIFLNYDMKQDYFYKILSWCKYENTTFYEIKLHCIVNINEEERLYIIQDRFIDYVRNNFNFKGIDEELINWTYEYLNVWSDFND